MHATIVDIPDELLATIFKARKYAERSTGTRPLLDGNRTDLWAHLIYDGLLAINSTSPPLVAVGYSVASSTPELRNELYVDIEWETVTLTNALQQTTSRSKVLSLTVSI
jgi:hypothetical protein